MSDMRHDASRIAAERVQALIRVANDPQTDPATAEQARIDAGTLALGLAEVSKSRARLETMRSERATHQRRAEWTATVRAYREWQRRPGNADRRPTQAEVAAERNIGERTLAGKLRAIGIDDWHDVHALVEIEP